MMAKPQVKLSEIVELIRLHGPVSPNQLTEITGDWRQSIDQYIRKARRAGLIHVADFGPSPNGGNRTVKLYVVGQGVDAKRVYAHERKRQEAVEQIRQKRSQLVKCRRDPFISSFYGP